MSIAIAIVGCGSRGLSVLERCLTFAEHTGIALTVHVIDPRGGEGIHDLAQPDYLLLNTICGQVSQFPDAATIDHPWVRNGPDLREWAVARGYRLHADGYTVGPEGERDIKFTDHLPRRLLGEYLRWFRAHLLAQAPAYVRIVEHRHTAVSAVPGGGFEVIGLDDGSSLRVDHLFLTLGHLAPRSVEPASAVLNPYPIPAALRGIGAGERVAINGFGLSAMDVIAALTHGRGGRHVDGRYLPSGQEPRLCLFSRSGLPFRARPFYDRQHTHAPLFLTPERVAGLPRPLDFAADIMPLITAELEARYYLQHTYLSDGWPVALVLREAMLTGSVDRAGLVSRFGDFSATACLQLDLEGLRDAQDYEGRLTAFLTHDLQQATLGLHGSPLKTALETFRDCRNTIRAAVDFGQLTPASHREFMGTHTALMNRMAVCPQKERHGELLALFAAGIASAPFGPRPEVCRVGGRWEIASTALARPHWETLDHLLGAYAQSPTLAGSDSPLLRCLAASGRIRPLRADWQSIAVDRSYHPLDADDRPLAQVWVLGPLLEGTTFYNHYVPSPRAPSRALQEAHDCVAELFHGLQASGLKQLATAQQR